MQEQKKRELARTRQTVALWKIGAFVVLLVVMGFIGLLWFARPKESVVEKRELTKFPQITMQGVLDGSFCSGVDTWYADTYPLREGLISLDTKFESLYGIRKDQFVDSGQVAEEIPDESVDLEALASQGREETEAPTDESAAPAQTDAGETTETEETLEYGAGDVDTPAEQAGSIYITENCGYGVYYFNQSGSARYVLAINKLAQNLKGKAQVYCMIGPISAGIMLSDKVQQDLGFSDEKEALNWMYSQMDSAVKTVNVYDTLKQHNSEYIYYHTDHHWTALGAYYAYREFCRQKGVTPNELSDFETYEFTGFLGTFYSSSGKSPALAANPDTVTAYIPNGTNDMTMFVNNGNGTYTEYAWRVVNDVSDYAKSELYATFAGGDQPFNYAHNEQIHDSSTVLIVKDSYGNSVIPFFVDHYEHIYWIDYRYYRAYCQWAGTGNDTVSGFVSTHNVNDVIIINNIGSTGDSGLLDGMEKLYQ